MAHLIQLPVYIEKFPMTLICIKYQGGPFCIYWYLVIHNLVLDAWKGKAVTILPLIKRTLGPC